MKSKIFTPLIFVQVTIVIFLLYQIQQKNKTAHSTSINPIDIKTIQKTPSGGLKYFYEPKAGTVLETQKKWLSHKVTYTINKDALNERFDYPVNKNKGTFRIITMGDSYTYGLNVPTPDNWTELIEDKLNSEIKCKNVNKFEVINLAMEGYDTEYEVERYKLRGEKYHPDLVIWYVTDLLRVTDKIKKISETIKINDEDSEKNNIFYVKWRIAQEALLNTYGEKGLMDYQAKSFNEFRQKYYQGPLLIMTKNTYRAYLTDNINVNSIFFGDVGKVENDKKYFLLDGHFNEEGHKIIAESVFEYLVKYSLFLCKQQKNQ